MLRFLGSHFELLFWPAALLLLYWMPVEGEHLSFCALNAFGFSWCPGCGIGHSIHYYLHFNFVQGWREHYLGIFAVLIILYRIFQLLNAQLKQKPAIDGQ